MVIEYREREGVSQVLHPIEGLMKVGKIGRESVGREEAVR
jgi:hypothetical protein